MRPQERNLSVQAGPGSAKPTRESNTAESWSQTAGVSEWAEHYHGASRIKPTNILDTPKKLSRSCKSQDRSGSCFGVAGSHAGMPTSDEEAKRLFTLGSQAANAGDHSEAHSQFTSGLEVADSVEIKSALLISRSKALAGLQLWDEALQDAEACQSIRPSW